MTGRVTNDGIRHTLHDWTGKVDDSILRLYIIVGLTSKWERVAPPATLEAPWTQTTPPALMFTSNAGMAAV